MTEKRCGITLIREDSRLKVEVSISTEDSVQQWVIRQAEELIEEFVSEIGNLYFPVDEKVEETSTNDSAYCEECNEQITKPFGYSYCSEKCYRRNYMRKYQRARYERLKNEIESV